MKTKGLYVTLFCLLPLTAAAQTPDSIVDKVLAARGGLHKIRAVQAERVSGHISFGQDAQSPSVVALKRLPKKHIAFTVHRGTTVPAHHGKSAGYSTNPF